jgi:hypothetical protein
MALTEATIERRLLTFVDRWLGTYLRLQCEEEDRDVARMVVPRASPRSDADRRYAETDLPAVIVDLPQAGTAQSGRSTGTWDTWQPVRVVVVTGGDGAIARDDAGTYLGALRQLFLTRQSLDGLAAGVTYVGDGIDDAPVGQSRFMAFGTLDLSVLLRAIADRNRLADGELPPPQPDPQPEPDVPVDGLDIDIDAREPTP